MYNFNNQFTTWLEQQKLASIDQNKLIYIGPKYLERVIFNINELLGEYMDGQNLFDGTKSLDHYNELETAYNTENNVHFKEQIASQMDNEFRSMWNCSLAHYQDLILSMIGTN
jgi:hypothetical protein